MNDLSVENEHLRDKLEAQEAEIAQNEALARKIEELEAQLASEQAASKAKDAQIASLNKTVERQNAHIDA